MSTSDFDYYMNLYYQVDVHKIPDNEGGGYYAMIPQFGYSILGDGSTPDEAIRDLDLCKRKMFRIWLARGIDIPFPIPKSNPAQTEK